MCFLNIPIFLTLGIRILDLFRISNFVLRIFWVFSPRSGRTYPGPPPEAAGLITAKVNPISNNPKNQHMRMNPDLRASELSHRLLQPCMEGIHLLEV